AEATYRIYAHVPQLIKKYVIEPTIRSLPVSHSYMSIDFRLKKFLEGATAEDRYRHQQWIGSFSEQERDELLSCNANVSYKNTRQILDSYWSSPCNRDIYQKILHMYMRIYLMDQVLAKVDRASMAHGLEVRAPFLDYQLVDFVFNLPYNYKYNVVNG